MELSRVELITREFKRLLGRIPTGPELRTYLSAKGEMSHLIQNTDEYRLKIKTKIDYVYRPLLGKGCDSETLNKFLEYCKSNKTEAHKSSTEFVGEFVSKEPEFYEKYSKLVEDVFLIEKGIKPDLRTKDKWVKRFQNTSFSPSELSRLLKQDHDEPPNEVVVCKVSSDRVVTSRELKFVELWSSVTGEKIDIYEFLRYFEELGSNPDPGDIKSLKARQEKAFAEARDVYRDYLSVNLDFDRFSISHMWDYDKKGFAPGLVASIVSGEEYQKVMKKKVSESYVKSFDREIHSQDLNHVFALAKSKNLSLKPEGISRLVLDLGEELKEISAEVTKIYKTILLREPDELETRNCVHDFRSSEKAKENIKTRLYRELEYHDVLKNKIVESSGCAKPSVVYRILSAVISKCKDKMETAESYIDECVSAEGF